MRLWRIYIHTHTHSPRRPCRSKRHLPKARKINGEQIRNSLFLLILLTHITLARPLCAASISLLHNIPRRYMLSGENINKVMCQWRFSPCVNVNKIHPNNFHAGLLSAAIYVLFKNWQRQGSDGRIGVWTNGEPWSVGAEGLRLRLWLGLRLGLAMGLALAE